MIFVNSMSDLFHKDIPREHIAAVFDTMEKADWHTYQVLTKRSSLLLNSSTIATPGTRAPPHMWFGVSVETQAGYLADRAFAGGAGRASASYR